MRLKAILFDVDGTLAETEEWHREAFNAAFAEAGLPWRWDRTVYRRLLATTGGKERMLAYARDSDPERLARIEAEVATLHRAKNAHYARLAARGGADLRPGVRRLIGEAREAGVRLAVVTTTSRDNLAALIAAAFGAAASPFEVLVCGEDVKAKKPDPEAYAIALHRLALPPRACVAVEDSLNGLKAARAAGLAAVVTPSLYTDHERFDDAALIVADLDRAPDGGPVTLATIQAALAGAEAP